MKKLALAIVCTAVFGLSGCGTTGGTSEGAGGGGSSEVAGAIKEAEAAISKAKSAGGEWRDSKSKFIKQAKAAASKGDNKKALNLAKKAKFEGEMGYQQAMEQKTAKPWLF